MRLPLTVMVKMGTGSAGALRPGTDSRLSRSSTLPSESNASRRAGVPVDPQNETVTEETGVANVARTGIGSVAMAAEPIPVRATFPTPVSSVTVSFWGSTGTPALLEAFDADGNVVDQARLESVPGRKTPGDPVPIFTMTVSAKRIAYIQFSGPREGEYLAADEVRFTPLDGGQ